MHKLEFGVSIVFAVAAWCQTPAAQEPVTRPPATQPPVTEAPANATDAPARASVALGDTGLHMVLPEGCEVGDAKSLGLRFLAARPAGDLDGLHCNVADNGPKAPTAKDREAVCRQLTAALKKALAKYELVENGVRQLWGKDAVWLSGRFEAGGVVQRNYQVFVPTEPSYCITFQMAEDAYDKIIDEINAALATLTVGETRQTPGQVVVRKDGDRLHVDAHRFSIEPPPGWQESDPAMAMGAFLFVTGPVENDFAVNVNVRTTGAITKLDVPATSRAIKTELATLPEGKVEDVIAVKLGSTQCLRTRATYKMPMMELAMVQYLVPGTPSSFVVTYTMPKRSAASWLKVIEKSAASIEIGDGTARSGSAGAGQEGKR